MKRLLMTGVCAAASVFLLVVCGSKGNDKNSKIEQEGTVKMARTKTTSGLEYEILKDGSGESPKMRQKVTVHYTGWLDIDGTPGPQFDSSVDRGQPFTFTIGVGQVIQGWDEGVISMKIGEKRRLFIPAKLAYGARGAGASIPPHAALIFDVELLKVS